MVMVVPNFENSGIDGVSEINCNLTSQIVAQIFKAELTESGIQIDTRFFSLMKLDRFRCDYCSIIFGFAKCMSNRTCTFYIVQNIEWP